MKTTKEKTTKEKRDERICRLYSNYSEKYTTRLELYMDIAKEVQVSHITVIRVLQRAGLVQRKGATV